MGLWFSKILVPSHRDAHELPSRSMTPPPYFTYPPDIRIPIPNTRHRLPLIWEEIRAIQRLAKFFAGLYSQMQSCDDQSGLEKYKSWMITLFQMNASIYEGIHFRGTFLTRVFLELVRINDPDQICQFL